MLGMQLQQEHRLPHQPCSLLIMTRQAAWGLQHRMQQQHRQAAQALLLLPAKLPAPPLLHYQRLQLSRLPTLPLPHSLQSDPLRLPSAGLLAVQPHQGGPGKDLSQAVQPMVTQLQGRFSEQSTWLMPSVHHRHHHHHHHRHGLTTGGSFPTMTSTMSRRCSPTQLYTQL